jgi:hypothetical protein
MKALVFENRVVDLVDTEFEVHSNFTWMDSPIGCETGWLLEDGVLIAPPSLPEKTYDQLRKKEYNMIFGEYLDGIVKDDQAQIDKYIEDCKAIKTKYPKG